MNIDIAIHEKFSDTFSDLEEDKVHFSANYFIHDYSSDTNREDIKSFDAKLLLKRDDIFSHNFEGREAMSEKDLKYYKDIDEENIIEIQNTLICDYMNENPELFPNNRQLNFKSLVIENDFLMRIFPMSKKEKPGVDLYNYGVVFQFLIV